MNESMLHINSPESLGYSGISKVLKKSETNECEYLNLSFSI